jgi:hypothetical protein
MRQLYRAKMVKYKINKFYFVKNQVCFAILLILGFSFLVCLFPFTAVHAAKIQSGMTIKAPSTNETAPTSPTAGTCGLQILSGVPINYGQLTVGQVSNEQKVTYKNVGNAPAKVMVKGSDWVGGTPPNDTYAAEITRVAVTPGMEFAKKFPLHSSETTTLGDLGAGQEGDSFWSVYADNHLTGSPHQEITIDLTC